MGPVEKRLRDQISKYGTICLGLVDSENTNVEDAIEFNNFHEGIHLGYVLALKRLI